MLRLGQSLCKAAAPRSRAAAFVPAIQTPPFPSAPIQQKQHPFHTTATLHFGLEDFRDSVPRQQRMTERVGRSWSVRELRRKSYDDLHKLWYVLYKERNMLLTEKQLSRRKNIIFPQPDRMRKVRKSMGAIKHVLGERKRAHLESLEEKQKQEQEDEEDGPTPMEA